MNERITFWMNGCMGVWVEGWMYFGANWSTCYFFPPSLPGFARTRLTEVLNAEAGDGEAVFAVTLHLH